MDIIRNSPILLGIYITLLATFLIYIVNLCRKNIKPIKYKKVFSSRKYDEKILENGSYVLTEFDESTEFFRRVVAHCIYRNNSGHDIAINKANLVIDKILPREYKRVDLICDYNEQVLHFYVINNGNVTLDDLNIRFGMKGGNVTDLKELLGAKFAENYKVQNLESGEILEIASWIPNKKKFIKTYMKENWQIFEGCVWDKGGPMVEKLYLGALFVINNELEFSYCQGGGADIEKGTVFLEDVRKQPQYYAVNLQYGFASNSDKHIQIAIYPKETCEIQYYFEIYTNTLIQKCRSSMGIAYINVPIYETDNTYFFTLRQWLQKYKITHYCLNDNRAIENEILAFPPLKNI